MVTYDYRDESGTLVYQKVRQEPKGFYVRQPDGHGGHVDNRDGTRSVLYRLNEFQGCKAVVLCEGEKDADRLWALGIPATTTPDGAKTKSGKNWRREYTEQLRAAGVERLVATPDNDEAGRVYATDAASACNEDGINTRVVALPGLPPKGDVSDWLDMGHTRGELLTALADAAPLEPDQAGASTDDGLGDEGGRRVPGDVDEPRDGRPRASRSQRRGPTWPRPLAPAALHGVFGDLVRLVEPHTEADPVALLLQALVAFGNVIGRGAYFLVGATRHHLNLFALVVGSTAKARKGTSKEEIFRFFRALDEAWTTSRVLSGLSSGEGLIWAVRDPIKKTKPKRDAPGHYETVIDDPGIDDKRLLVVESEFAHVLKVLKREGNTLSPTMRQAWDGGNLNIITKQAAAKATDAHISILGHITEYELRFGDTETANGFGNRFLTVCVQRSKFLPEGGRLDDEDTSPVVTQLRSAVNFVERNGPNLELRRDDEARALWISIYRDLSSGHPGVLGMMTARAEAQVTRLACLYALGDASAVVRIEHLEAALALWTYCFESARHLFGDSTGVPLADQILGHLQQAVPDGVTRTEISNALSGNRTAATIDRALEFLESHGLARQETDSSKSGRPPKRWYAIEHDTTYERNERTPDEDGPDGINSFISSDSDDEAASGWGPIR